MLPKVAISACAFDGGGGRMQDDAGAVDLGIAGAACRGGARGSMARPSPSPCVSVR